MDPTQSEGASREAGLPGQQLLWHGWPDSGRRVLHLFAGNATSDKTEGRKKGRPKAENQALKDIPVRPHAL